MLTAADFDVAMTTEILAKLQQAQSAYASMAPTAEIAAKDIAHNAKTAENTITTVNTVLEITRIPNMDQQFRLLLDKDYLPANQLVIAGNIGEIAQLEQALGCTIEIVDANSIPSGLNPQNTIAITGNPEAFIAAGAKAIAIDKIENTQYMPLAPLAVFAKAMLVVNNDLPDVGQVKSIIQNAYRMLTGIPLAAAELEAYIANPTAFITLVIPGVGVVYGEGELEVLHMQALQVLIAA